MVHVLLAIFSCRRREDKREGWKIVIGLFPLVALGVERVVAQHLIGNIGASTELITKSLSFAVYQDTTDASHEFSSQDLAGIGGILWIDPPRRVNLDLLHIDSAGAKGGGKCHTIAGREISRRGRKPQQFWTILGQIRTASPIGCETSGGQHNVGCHQSGRTCVIIVVLLQMFDLNANDSSILVLNQLLD